MKEPKSSSLHMGEEAAARAGDGDATESGSLMAGNSTGVNAGTTPPLYH